MNRAIQQCSQSRQCFKNTIGPARFPLRFACVSMGSVFKTLRLDAKKPNYVGQRRETGTWNSNIAGALF
jgi:hypothetical protein